MVIADFFSSFGGWSWIIGGFVLLLLELVVPGVFLVWIGLAALLTGVVALIAIGSATALLGIQGQIILFLALSAIFVISGKRWQDRRGRGPQDGLNEPDSSLVGRRLTLVEPIVNGIGRARVGDSSWRVEGTDRPEGSTVVVTGRSGSTLLVRPED